MKRLCVALLGLLLVACIGPPVRSHDWEFTCILGDDYAFVGEASELYISAAGFEFTLPGSGREFFLRGDCVFAEIVEE